MKRKSEQEDLAKENAAKRKKLQEHERANTTESEIGHSNNLICSKDDENHYSKYPGRKSFGGFNPIVEKQYTAALDATNNKYKINIAKEDSNSVNELETSNQYEALVSLPRGPSQVI